MGVLTWKYLDFGVVGHLGFVAKLIGLVEVWAPEHCTFVDCTVI